MTTNLFDLATLVFSATERLKFTRQEFIAESSDRYNCDPSTQLDLAKLIAVEPAFAQKWEHNVQRITSKVPALEPMEIAKNFAVAEAVVNEHDEALKMKAELKCADAFNKVTTRQRDNYLELYEEERKLRIQVEKEKDAAVDQVVRRLNSMRDLATQLAKRLQTHQNASYYSSLDEVMIARARQIGLL